MAWHNIHSVRDSSVGPKSGWTPPAPLLWVSRSQTKVVAAQALIWEDSTSKVTQVVGRIHCHVLVGLAPWLTGCQLRVILSFERLLAFPGSWPPPSSKPAIADQVSLWFASLWSPSASSSYVLFHTPILITIHKPSFLFFLLLCLDPYFTSYLWFRFWLLFMNSRRMLFNLFYLQKA